MRKNFLPVIACVFALHANAKILLPSVISSNMVLQQKSSVTLWGWSGPAEKIFVTTSWSKTVDSAVATRDAKWQLQVRTPEAGGPYTITLKGENTIVLENVMIGEVWVCSGQSNMEWSYYNGLDDIKKELPASYNKNIRFFHIPKTTSIYPQEDCKAQWEVCDSNTLKGFSAVAYFFGKKLSKEINVPVGLIESAWGGTPAEVWTPEAIVNNDAQLKEAAGKLQPFDWWPHKPGYTFNAMIAPITNYKIAGAIWYQGESNTGTSATYSKLFTTMIDAWRSAWQNNFPFYYVQIAPFKYGNNNIGALLREQQTKSMNHPNTGMAVITDLVDDTTNIHPINKHDVGARLANIALVLTYHENGIAYMSPFFQNMQINKDKAEITFSNAMNGLLIKGSKISELYIAGADKIFYPADAKLDGNTIIVSSKQVKKPVAVRYAFSNTAIGNLFSKEGLPAAPFRTDDWEQ